jgi:nicotinamide-nucleotide amidase
MIPTHHWRGEWPSGRFCLLLLILLPSWARAGQSGSGTSEQPVDYMIVATGGELLVGVYADSHTQFLTQTLRPLGLRCVGSVSVDDKRSDIQDALRFATHRAKLVIVTGGLGPTENDVTREAISEFTGIALRENPDVIRAMADRFKVPADQLRANLRRQTQVPDGGAYLKNANGTAIGLVFEYPRAVIVALPGPPRELQPMVRDELVPYLSRRFGTRQPGCWLTLRFVGLGQSQISQTIDENRLLSADVIVSSQFEGGRVDYTFTLPDDTPQGRARLEELKQQILKHLGDHVYAADQTSLEDHVLHLLAKRNATLALAEIGSGGVLAASLSSVESARGVLVGAYVAPAGETLRRLLEVPDEPWNNATTDRERIERLAAAAAERTGSVWAIAAGQVRQEQAGAAYVDVAIRTPDGRTESRRVEMRGSGQSARAALTTSLLDVLRRKLR